MTPVGSAVTRAGGGDSAISTVVLSAAGGWGTESRSEVRASIERMLGLRVDLSAFYRMAADDTSDRPSRRTLSGSETAALSYRFRELAQRGGMSAVVARGWPEPAQPSRRTHTALPCRRRFIAPCLPQPARPRQPRADRRFANSVSASARQPPSSSFRGRGCADGSTLRASSVLPTTKSSSKLTSLSGIGRWSAEYVLLRGLGRLHVFPGDDVGARNNLARWLSLGRRSTTAPWRGRSPAGSPTPGWSTSTCCSTAWSPRMSSTVVRLRPDRRLDCHAPAGWRGRAIMRTTQVHVVAAGGGRARQELHMRASTRQT